MNVPFLDLRKLHEPLMGDFVGAFASVVKESAFSSGPFVQKLEASLPMLTGLPRNVGVSSGSSALSIALQAAGVPPGTEIVIPANTFVATAEAVLRVGCIPVFCDVDEASMLMSLESLADCLGRNTSAVIPVHLHGNMVNVESLMRLVGESTVIVEDAAQAHGARFQGSPPGEYSEAATYSFFPGKNLGALGEAGSIATSKESIADLAILLRSWGEKERYQHSLHGFNERMDGLQAALLSIKLSHFRSWEERRWAIARRYRDLLEGLPEVRLPDFSNPERSWHIFAVRVPDRLALQAHLSAAGISTGIHYPVTIPDQPAFADFRAQAAIPNARQAAEHMLSLPICPTLDDDAVDFVAETCRAFFKGR